MVPSSRPELKLRSYVQELRSEPGGGGGGEEQWGNKIPTRKQTTV